MRTGRGKQPRIAVDWAAINARLTIMAADSAQDATISPERARQLLVERARLLARPVAEPRVSGAVLDVVTFGLAGERYAIESSFVREAFRLGTLARLPGARPPLLGLTPWRGELLTILDVRQALGLSPSALNDLGHIIALGQNRPEFGIVVDSLDGTLGIPADDLGPPPASDGEGDGLVRGITSDALLVIDAGRLLGL